MPPFQQVSSSNFYPAKAVPVNCKCCYCEVAISRLSREMVGHTSSQFGSLQSAGGASVLGFNTYTEFQIASGSNISTRAVCRELHEIGLHGLRTPCAMPSVGCSGVKLTAIGLWSSGNMFSGVMNHSSPSGSPTTWVWRMLGEATCPKALFQQ